MATVSENEMTIDHAEIMAKVRALGDKGLYLQAYECSRDAGPLHAWTGTAECCWPPAWRHSWPLRPWPTG